MERGTWRLDDVLFAAEATRGNISAAAERLGCSRLSLYKYLARTPRAQQAFLDWRERLVDLAEDRLWECVDERQPWAIALVLKTRGRARGWGEQPTVPVSTPDGVQIYLPVKGSIAAPIKFYLPVEDAVPEPVQVDLQWGDAAVHKARERVQATLNQMARREDQASVLPVPATTVVVQEDPVDDAVAEATRSKLTDT